MKYLLIIVLLFTFALVTAKDKDGQYSIQGARSCGEWVKDRKKGGWEDVGWEEIADRGWIIGYISAYNMQTSGVYDNKGSTGLESIYLWMDKYCQENPLSHLGGGMKKLTNELWPNRKRTKDN